jgi:hypothetical protein
MRFVHTVLSLALCACSPSPTESAIGTLDEPLSQKAQAAAPAACTDPFFTTGNLGFGRTYAAVAAVSGQVLVAGGAANANQTGAMATSELYSPQAGTFAPAASLGVARARATATVLGNGKVLIVGGANDGADALASAELYDPATAAFQSAGSMAQARVLHTATLLSDGRVLVTGGYSTIDASGAVIFDGKLRTLISAEIYDPTTNAFSAAGNLTARRARHEAVLMADGRVLVAGGHDPVLGEVASAEIYDPASNAFTATGSMATPRRRHSMTLTRGNQIFVAGGSNGATDLGTTELYDPGTGQFSAGPSLLAVRGYHSATTLPMNHILLIGGYGGGYLTSAEIYDPKAGSMSSAGDLSVAREAHSAAPLPKQQVLIVGGNSGGAGIATAEVFDSRACN